MTNRSKLGAAFVAVALVMWIAAGVHRPAQSYDQPPLPYAYTPLADFGTAHAHGCFASLDAFRHCRFAPIHTANAGVR